MYCSFYFIDILMMAFLTIFRKFMAISEDFRKLSKICSEVTQKLRTFFKDIRSLPKIAKDFRGRPEDIWIMHNEFRYNLRDKLDVREMIIIVILTSEDMENTPPESRMCFRMNFTSGVFSSKTLLSI